MTNFSVGSGSPSPIPGQRISKEAQKSQALEKMQRFMQDASSPEQKTIVSRAMLGGVLGGMLGSLAGLKLDLPNNQSYTIQKGDNLNSIAKSQLGSGVSGEDVEKFIDKVLDLNPDIIKNPHEIYKGDTIAIPRASHEGAAKQVQSFVD